MNILDFTAEETSLIAIYAVENRVITIKQIVDTLPHMDEQMQAIATRSTAKLATMSDGDFAATMFVPANDLDNIA